MKTIIRIAQIKIVPEKGNHAIQGDAKWRACAVACKYSI